MRAPGVRGDVHRKHQGLLGGEVARGDTGDHRRDDVLAEVQPVLVTRRPGAPLGLDHAFTEVFPNEDYEGAVLRDRVARGRGGDVRLGDGGGGTGRLRPAVGEIGEHETSFRGWSVRSSHRIVASSMDGTAG